MSIDDNTSGTVPSSNEVLASKPACCSMRSLFQTPMLLVAAASVGFSAQQVWKNPEVHSLFSGQSASVCGMSAGSPCCAHANQQALMATMLTGSHQDCPLTMASTGCCSSAATQSAVTEEERPISALTASESATDDNAPVSATSL